MVDDRRSVKDSSKKTDSGIDYIIDLNLVGIKLNERRKAIVRFVFYLFFRILIFFILEGVGSIHISYAMTQLMYFCK